MMFLPALAAAFFATAPAVAQDVATVEANGDGIWRDARLVEELRIGRLDGPEEYLFGSITHMAVRDDGSIYVVDGQGPRLRLYSPDGRYLRDIGRTGEGPGEYRSIMGIGITPDGLLAVYDVRLRRISLFDRNGDYMRSVATQSGSWIGGAFRIDTAGNFIVFTPRYATRTDAQGRTVIIEGAGSTRSMYLVHSAAGAVVDSLAIPESTTERKPSFVVMTNEGNLQPFVDELTFALSPHGYLVSGHTSEYAIARLDRDARPVSRFVRDYEPVRLNREERAQWCHRAAAYAHPDPLRSAALGRDARRVRRAVRRPVSPPPDAAAPRPESLRALPRHTLATLLAAACATAASRS